MRDKVIHQYFGVDLQVLWDTVQQDIPILQPLIHQILEDLTLYMSADSKITQR